MKQEGALPESERPPVFLFYFMRVAVHFRLCSPQVNMQIPYETDYEYIYCISK